MTTITIINCDTYMALYIDGELNFWDDTYNFDFEYGFGLGRQYPEAEVEHREVDADWLYEEKGGDMPQNIRDVQFA